MSTADSYYTRAWRGQLGSAFVDVAALRGGLAATAGRSGRIQRWAAAVMFQRSKII